MIWSPMRRARASGISPSSPPPTSIRNCRSCDRDGDEEPVVPALRADLPGLRDADGEVLDGLALEARDEEVLELDALPALAGAGAAGEILEAPAPTRVEQAGGVHHRAGEARDGHLRAGEGRQDEREGEEAGQGAFRHFPNFTAGAWLASGVVAVNWAFGCLW